MRQAFQFLLQEKSKISVDSLAAKLYHVCGGSRYIQKYPYIMMADISHMVDPIRAKDLFQEWTRLLFEDVDTIPDFVEKKRDILNILFKYFYTTEKVRPFNELIQTWFVYHYEKDIWFSFRNKRPSMSSKERHIFKYLHTLSVRKEQNSFLSDQICSLFPQREMKMEYETMKVPTLFPRKRERLPIYSDWYSSSPKQELSRFMRSTSHEALLTEMRTTPSPERKIDVTIYTQMSPFLTGINPQEMLAHQQEARMGIMPTCKETLPYIISGPRLVYESKLPSKNIKPISPQEWEYMRKIGTGKTCSAISLAHDYMSRMHFPKYVYIKAKSPSSTITFTDCLDKDGYMTKEMTVVIPE